MKLRLHRAEQGLLRFPSYPPSTGTSAAKVLCYQSAAFDPTSLALLASSGRYALPVAVRPGAARRTGFVKGQVLLELLDVERARPLRCSSTLTGHTEFVGAVAALADGRLATVSDDKTIKLWDPTTGRCVRTLNGHTDWVCAVAALANGQIATGSRDKTVKLWDPTTGRCVQTLRVHKAAVYSVATISDGRIVTGSHDKTVKVWDPTTKTVLANAQRAYRLDLRRCDPCRRAARDWVGRHDREAVGSHN
ncbi:MAG: WD40 repeat domain-containing protein [Clostridia bacterium]|nr:WD40 repeat domain-containing protein [Deltaproteobacteria bacterium]